jgi:hypothetical protein
MSEGMEILGRYADCSEGAANAVDGWIVSDKLSVPS